MSNRLSVIVPCYNEGANINACYNSLDEYFRSRTTKVEFVFVNDGSTDNTRLLLNRLKRKDKRVTVISYMVNRGKGHAVKCGLLGSRHFTKLVLDADLSISVSGLSMVDFKQRWYVVKAKRKFVNEPVTRRILSWGWHALVRVYTGLPYDTQAPFTVLRVPRKFYKKLDTSGFAYDVEILYKAKRHKYTIVEITLPYFYTKGSKVTTEKTLRMLKEIKKIKK